MNPYEISPDLKVRHPSLLGVIPPGLRCAGHLKSRRNIPESIPGFFNNLAHFVENFGYDGAYHNPDHFNDVDLRFADNIKYLQQKYPGEFSERDYVAASMFAQGHDCVHNAERNIAYVLTVNGICTLYGYPDDNHSRIAVHDAMNYGNAEDNKANNGNRPLVPSWDEPIELSEEEMAAIVVDAIAYSNAISFETRCQVSGMIQASELKRSQTNGQPGFKRPRTQMEVLARLSDIGNFCDDIEPWLETSVNINVEVPWFTGTDVLSFIEEELHFINHYAKAMLETENIPLLRLVDGHELRARIPDYFPLRIREKEEYLLAMKERINELRAGDPRQELLANPANTPQRDIDDQLGRLAGIVRPALAKNNPALADPATPVPLALPPNLDRTLS